MKQTTQIKNIPTKQRPTDNSRLKQLADGHHTTQEEITDALQCEMEESRFDAQTICDNIVYEETKKLNTTIELYEERLKDNSALLDSRLQTIEKYQNANDILRQKKDLQKILLNMTIYARKNKCVFDIFTNNEERITATFIENGFMLDFIVDFIAMDVYVIDTDAETDAIIDINTFIKFQSRFLTD